MAHEDQSDNAHLEGDDSDAPADLVAIRAEYRERFGKQPYHGWDIEELQRRIKLAKAGVAPDVRHPAEEEPIGVPAVAVRVMVMVDHVYLPENLTLPNWESANTVRYDGMTNGRRTKLDVHPSLAAFLQDRKQAEILD